MLQVSDIKFRPVPGSLDLYQDNETIDYNAKKKRSDVLLLYRRFHHLSRNKGTARINFTTPFTLSCFIFNDINKNIYQPKFYELFI